MIVKLLTEHHLECLSLKGGCRGSSESALVKMSIFFEISCRVSNVNNKRLLTTRIIIRPVINSRVTLFHKIVVECVYFITCRLLTVFATLQVTTHIVHTIFKETLSYVLKLNKNKWKMTFNCILISTVICWYI